MANLKNGTLNYFLTKDLDALENRENALRERNDMDPSYPDPNEERFKQPLPVYTIENNQLYRDGNLVGKIYNNTTGKIVEITEVTEDTFYYIDTEENAIITKDISISVVSKLIGLKSEGTSETRIVAVFDVTSTSNPTTLAYSSSMNEFTEMEIDGIVQPSVISEYIFDTTGEHTVKYTLVDPTQISDNYPFYNCEDMISVAIPNGVTSIGKWAFYSCDNLMSVTIPNSVLSIRESAFEECIRLSSIITSNSIMSIEDRAFRNCVSFNHIIIDESVVSIGISAFAYCYSSSITVKATTPPTLGQYAFDFTENCPIYVPSGSVDVYKAASGWSTYASRIQAIP